MRNSNINNTLGGVAGLRTTLLWASSAVIICYGCASGGSGPIYEEAKTPEESISTFQLADDRIKVELFASEPWVIDPVSMEFDEDGNAWVVGMLDAYKPDSVKGRGQIVMLKDLDQDGSADTSIVFADSLREATSLLPWEGGLLITAAPYIFFFKDTDSDGRADRRDTVFKGFFNKNEEAQITNLRYGIDNWIYANNNGQAGNISYVRGQDTSSLSVKGWDFRFRLDRGQFEAATGRGQFGLAMDHAGHRFYTQNTDHVSQIVFDKRYLDRNPYLPKALTRATLNISDHDPIMFQLTPPPYWRAERTRQRNQKSRENGLPEKEFAEDHFTGGSGGTMYTGSLLPGDYYGSIFTGDVAGNLVHRDILKDIDSPYLRAVRGELEKEKEFLATSDSWVRPASFTEGPDGSLFMIDMYRQHIETPLSIPADLQVGMDFNAGDKFGRIYRITSKDAPTLNMKPLGLRQKSSQELLELLSHSSQWWRLTAQRLLLERKDPSIVPSTIDMCKNHSNSYARLHALYVLEGLSALNDDLLREKLKDADAAIREHALMLSEGNASFVRDVIALTEDKSGRVAFQAALSLGSFKGPEVRRALAKVLVNQGSSKWYRLAVLSAYEGSSIQMLESLMSDDAFTKRKASWQELFLKDIASIIRDRGDAGELKRLQSWLVAANVNGMESWRDTVRSVLVLKK